MAGRHGPTTARVTIRDVAEAAEVHVSTVSRALDPSKSSLIAEATRARVAAIAKDLGYQPHLVAAGLRRGQTMTVGIVVPDIGNPIYAPFARGTTHALEASGYMPLLADTQDDHDRLSRILGHLAERRIEALITTASRLPDEDLLVDLHRRGVPVVTAIRTVSSSGLASVLHDDRTGGRVAAQHLLELGHRRLAQVRGPSNVEPFLNRTEGFADAVTQAGHACLGDIEPVPELSAAEGYRAVCTLLDVPAAERPTGIFVQNDVMSLGALQAIRELGLRCPTDVSIVGYNDVFFAAHTDPPLTTVKLDAYGIGREAAAFALQLINDPDAAGKHVGELPELIVRRSTAAPSG